MDRFSWCNLQDAQPPMQAGEVALLTEKEGIRLYDGDDRTKYEDGKLILTTHRLLWIDFKRKGGPIGLQLELSSIASTEFSGGFLFMSSPKIIAQLYPKMPNHPTGPVNSSKHHFIKLSFRDSSSDAPEDFHEKLTEVRANKVWETTPQASRGTSTASTTSGNEAGGFGIRAIQRQREQELKNSDDKIRQAFDGDLKELMKSAKDLVKVAGKLNGKIMKSNGADDEALQLQSYLLNIGIANPVTQKKGTGAEYHGQLAKELALALKTPLNNAKGMMPLADVYCLYNRARGIDLVSPEDVLHACEQLERLNLPMRLRQFSSGVIVIQSLACTDEAIAEEIKTLLEKNEYITASSFAAVREISATLALQQLLRSEELGVICRDDTLQNLAFYPNRFLHDTSGS